MEIVSGLYLSDEEKNAEDWIHRKLMEMEQQVEWSRYAKNEAV